MQPSVPRGRRKKTGQPVIVTTVNSFKPKISERTIRRRQAEKEKWLKGGTMATGITIFGVVCLYLFLVLAFLIGAGAVVLCAIYTSDSDAQGWKIAGIVMGIITCVIAVILILLTIIKQTRYRRWRYRKTEQIYINEYGDINLDEEDSDHDDHDNQTEIENFYENRVRTSTALREILPNDENKVSQSANTHPPGGSTTRETASSPIHDSSTHPLDLKTANEEMIFCPGCNREHPTTHQCMYSTRVANGFATQYQPRVVVLPPQDSIAIQTEDDGKGKKPTKSHTLIDRSLKYSHTTDTQTDVSANPRSNITESIILRRVPIPTAKVVVQQPTTKVMIVKVPNVAGQLVIQPRSATTDN